MIERQWKRKDCVCIMYFNYLNLDSLCAIQSVEENQKMFEDLNQYVIIFSLSAELSD